ncbi:MAG: Transcriptional regulatory protein DegU [Dehalococcoidia bacterium]|nr:Transcriptional regulatory protein DegU [Bacillota bacterium]
MSERIKVLIVDDHTLFRQGLQKVLETYEEVQVVAEASNGKEAIARVGEVFPDLVLMDVKMPRMDGIECIRLIKERYPGLNIIVLSMYDDAEYVLKAVNAGASGYMEKNISADRLVDTIKQVQGGEKPLVYLAVGSEVLQGIIPMILDVDNDKGLTEQERRVLRLMTEGKSNKQIAKELIISLQTVKGHVHNILRKLDATDRTHAVAEAMRQGLVK